MMPGAPNCQSPPWTQEEKEIVGRAWDVREAIFLHGKNLFRFGFPLRSYQAIRCMWIRMHPKLVNRYANTLDRELKQALDELEAVV